MEKKPANNRIRAVSIAVAALFFLAPTIAFAQNFSISEKIDQAKKDLEKLELRKSAKSAKYYETLVLYNKKTANTDWAWKEIALAIMHPETGELKTIKILKRGIELEDLSNEFTVTINPRLNGVIWNAYNTNFNVVKKSDNSHWLVLILKYPLFTKITMNGKTLSHVYYSPFSDDLWNSRFRKELKDTGDIYLRGQIREAFSDLEKRNVASRAVPGKNISEVIKEDLIYKIILTEHSDPDEFIDNQEKTVDRVLMLLGANKKNAYAFSTSSASARGIAQFIKGSYDLASGQYRKAALPGYSEGTKDHKQSLKASILLSDYSLDRLYKKFDPARIDKERDDLLAAAYNGGVGRVSSALKQFGDEWHKNHFTEVAQALKEVNNAKEEIDALSRKKTDKTFSKTQKSRELRELRKKLAILETKYQTLENARLRNETRIYLLKFKQILSSLTNDDAPILGYCKL